MTEPQTWAPKGQVKKNERFTVTLRNVAMPERLSRQKNKRGQHRGGSVVKDSGCSTLRTIVHTPAPESRSSHPPVTPDPQGSPPSSGLCVYIHPDI